jgi:DnaJ-class molecular chaperone
MFALSRIIPKHIILSKRKFTTASFLLAKNYYEILAVSKNSSQADVKKGYYKLAKKYHPDKNRDDPKAATLFQDIAEAYEVLGDDIKREEYDTTFASSVSTYGFSGKKSDTNNSEFRASRAWSYNLQTDPLDLFNQVFGDIAANFAASAEDNSSFAQRNIPCASVSISCQEAAYGVSKCLKFNDSTGELRYVWYLY